MRWTNIKFILYTGCLCAVKFPQCSHDTIGSYFFCCEFVHFGPWICFPWFEFLFSDFILILFLLFEVFVFSAFPHLLIIYCSLTKSSYCVYPFPHNSETVHPPGDWFLLFCLVLCVYSMMHMCMYVCMYVCMGVCKYVCMYVLILCFRAS